MNVITHTENIINNIICVARKEKMLRIMAVACYAHFIIIQQYNLFVDVATKQDFLQ